MRPGRTAFSVKDFFLFSFPGESDIMKPSFQHNRGIAAAAEGV